LAAAHSRVRLAGYPRNRGRGFALRTGMDAARGDIVVTTELDLSWGADIVAEMVRHLRENQMFDLVVASPHLPGGGYRHVPAARVFLSRAGNLIIRACLPGALTMNTGMTRAYRRAALQVLPLAQDGKEFHVEVVVKARALGLSILEIPAVLTWRDPERVRRKNPIALTRMALSHLWFVVRASPAHSACAAGLAFLFAAFGALLLEEPAVTRSLNADHPFTVTVTLFRTAVTLLLLSLPLDGLARLIRKRWQSQSLRLAGLREEKAASVPRTEPMP
jgi:hypothetical protein